MKISKINMLSTLLAGPLMWGMPEAQAQAVRDITLYYQDVGGSGTILGLAFHDGRLSDNAGFMYDGEQWFYDISLPTQQGRVSFNGGIITSFQRYNIADGGMTGGGCLETPGWMDGFMHLFVTGDPSQDYNMAKVALPIHPQLPRVYLNSVRIYPHGLCSDVRDNPDAYALFQLVSTVATPTISPNGGSSSGPVQVTLACATEGAMIYYTTDGTAPTFESSTLYTAPFTLTASATVVAVAAKPGSVGSSLAFAAFTVMSAPTPSLTITRSGNGIKVSWPSASTGFVLQQNSDVTNRNGWADYSTAPSDDGTTKSVTINSPIGKMFFRLKK